MNEVYDGRVLTMRAGDHQTISVIDTYRFGTMLFLDDVPQTGGKYDPYITEAMYSVAYHAHGNPKNVLILGGGDLLGAQELLRHPVEKITLVEWDQKVTEAAIDYLFDSDEIDEVVGDPRLELRFEDARAFIRNSADRYDLIHISMTDPIAGSESFWGMEFLRLVRDRLEVDGMIASHCESPEPVSSSTSDDAFYRIVAGLSEVYSCVHPYRVWTPPYFEMFCRQVSSPRRPRNRTPQIADYEYRWLTPQIYEAGFVYFSQDVINKIASREAVPYA